MTSITIIEFDRLKKLMEMTFSQSDGEALNAMRAANKLIAAKNLNWKAVLERVISVDVEAAPMDERTEHANGSPTPRDQVINDAFQALRDGDKWNDFIGSLYSQWEEKSWLSRAQREALFKNVERTTR